MSLGDGLSRILFLADKKPDTKLNCCSSSNLKAGSSMGEVRRLALIAVFLPPRFSCRETKYNRGAMRQIGQCKHLGLLFPHALPRPGPRGWRSSACSQSPVRAIFVSGYTKNPIKRFKIPSDGENVPDRRIRILDPDHLDPVQLSMLMLSPCPI